MGEKFVSFESKLEWDKNVVFAEFRKRGSRTILGAGKRGVERPINPELKYYDVKYCCVFGAGPNWHLRSKEKGKELLRN